MAEIEPQSRVLEEGDDALIQGTEPGAKLQDGEEFVDLTKEDAAPAPAAAAPAKSKEPAAPAKGDEEDDIPQEYKGKSLKDIVKMHRDAEKLIGRQGSELGELRKRVDVAVQASLAALQRNREPAPAPKPAEPVAPVEIDESEFFAKPKDTIEKLIANHPRIKQIEAMLGKNVAANEATRAQASTERFNAAHPDAQEILSDPEFRQWVTASPIRQQLLAQAHSQFDFTAGDEVFSTWKALKGVKSASSKAGEAAAAAPAAAATPSVSEAARTLAAAKAQKAANAAAASAAAVPSGGASAGTGTGSGKKIYRRADVLKLMEEQPERYEAMADELSAAYREGRVR